MHGTAYPTFKYMYWLKCSLFQLFSKLVIRVMKNVSPFAGFASIYANPESYLMNKEKWLGFSGWCRGWGSNPRRTNHQVLSLTPLATREPLRRL